MYYHVIYKYNAILVYMTYNDNRKSIIATKFIALMTMIKKISCIF